MLIPGTKAEVIITIIQLNIPQVCFFLHRYLQFIRSIFIMKEIKKTELFQRAFVSFQLVFLFCGSPVLASPKLRVVSTFFHLYLFTKNVVGDQSGVLAELLLPASMGCPHDYSLSPGDIKKISRADLVIVNGLRMEEFLASSEWERMGNRHCGLRR